MTITFPNRLLLAGLLLMASTAYAMPRNIKLGDSVGPLKMTDIEGKAVATESWNGAPSALIFVAADQVSSEKAARDLQAAMDALTGANIHAVALTSDAVKIDYFKELRARENIRYPLAIDAGREIYGRIGVIVLPTTLLLDKDGKLAHVISGYDLAYGRTAQAKLARLAGRITADEEVRLLSTTQPAREEKHDRAERLCRSASIMLSRGLRGEAIQELKKAIEADPDCCTAYLQLARVQLTDGNFDEADKLIQQVQKREPSNRLAQLELGTVRFKQGKLDDAEKLLNEALVLNPDPTRTHYWLGRVAQSRGQADKAAEHFRVALEKAMPDLAESAPGKK
jgi:tetratricopeptide (TPR) repeat protein